MKYTINDIKSWYTDHNDNFVCIEILNFPSLIKDAYISVVGFSCKVIDALPIQGSFNGVKSHSVKCQLLHVSRDLDIYIKYLDEIEKTPLNRRTRKEKLQATLIMSLYSKFESQGFEVFPRDIPVTSFKNEYSFLSNFYEDVIPVLYDGKSFTSSEAAYQLAKLDKNHVKYAEQAEKFQQYTPSKSKKEGKKLPLRSDWDSYRLIAMRQILLSKFCNNPRLQKKLLETGEKELIEGNTWYDHFWGVCDGYGKNYLGKILMDTRRIIKTINTTGQV